MRRFLLLLCWLISISASAQPENFNKYKHDSYYEFDDLFILTAEELFGDYKSYIGLGEDDEMVFKGGQFLMDSTEGRGFDNSRYQQYYKGYEVHGKSMSLLSKCGIVLVANNFPISGLDIDVTDTITEPDALDSALAYINAPFGYIWEDPAAEDTLKAELEDTTATYLPKGKLIIVKNDGADTSTNYDLCWRFNFFYTDTIGGDTIQRDTVLFVNAHDGSIYRTACGIKGAWHTGTVSTPYNGTQDIQTSKCGLCFDYKLVDERDIVTWKKNGHIMKDGNNNWVDDQTTKDAGAAHWAVENAYDYFVNKFGYTKPGETYVKMDIAHIEEATWHASSGQENGIDIINVRKHDWSFDSNSSLDILSHEFTHLVVRHTSKLALDIDDLQPNGLLEGFCDIFGMLAERWVKGYADWSFGEDLWPYYKRNFNDPQNDVPDVSSVEYGDDDFDNDEYACGGVLRRWFNHMSQGESYWPVPYSGVGLDNAEWLTYWLMTWHLNTTSVYHDARDKSLEHAKYYWGECSPYWQAVQRAWNDVGISTFAVDCKKFGVPVNEVVEVNSSGATPNLTPFKVKHNYLDEEEKKPEDISYSWVLPVDWYGTFNVDRSEFYLDSTATMDAEEYSVFVSYKIDEEAYTDTLHGVVKFSSECSPMVSSKQSKTSAQYGILTLNEAKPKVVIYPNPASRILNVQLENTSKAVVSITNITGQQVYTSKVVNGTTQLNLPSLPPGTYLVRIKGDKLNIVNKIQIQ